MLEIVGAVEIAVSYWKVKFAEPVVPVKTFDCVTVTT
jgi:hypothetical protein